MSTESKLPKDKLDAIQAATERLSKEFAMTLCKEMDKLRNSGGEDAEVATLATITLSRLVVDMASVLALHAEVADDPNRLDKLLDTLKKHIVEPVDKARDAILEVCKKKAKTDASGSHSKFNFKAWLS